MLLVTLGWAFALIFWALSAAAALGVLTTIFGAASGIYQSDLITLAQGWPPVPALPFWLLLLFVSLFAATLATLTVETYRKTLFIHHELRRRMMRSEIQRIDQEMRSPARNPFQRPG